MIGLNVWPPSSDFQTPPCAAAKYQVFGSPGTPATRVRRPPIAGPMERNASAPYSAGGASPATTGRQAIARRQVNSGRAWRRMGVDFRGGKSGSARYAARTPGSIGTMAAQPW